MRTHVSFKADFRKSDSTDGPPGYELSEFLASKLQYAGVETSEPENHEDYAYSLDCNFEGRQFRLLIGLVDDGVREWLLLSEACIGILARLLGESGALKHQALSVIINRILTADGRISFVRWYTADGWDKNPEVEWSSSP